ncbi:MAG: hypothetical protein PWP51_256 [Clostridiales bacterium]|nr:hypothetical protein [Clostridiales bacterium]
MDNKLLNLHIILLVFIGGYAYNKLRERRDGKDGLYGVFRCHCSLFNNNFFFAAGNSSDTNERYDEYLVHHVLDVYNRCFLLGCLWHLAKRRVHYGGKRGYFYLCQHYIVL